MVVAAMRDEGEEGRRRAVVAIRDYDPKTDRDGTEAVERECEVGPAAAAGGMSLHADLLGDPVARIRHSPHYLMLVRTSTLSSSYSYPRPYAYIYVYVLLHTRRQCVRIHVRRTYMVVCSAAIFFCL
jgi:hypothetical protein